MSTKPNSIHELSFLRIWHITGDAKRGIDPLLPISRSSFLAGVKSGKYPKSLKIADRTTAWRREDILNLLSKINAQ